ncbi:MAG: hypothetical protein EZS28_045093, partial [Streblomastix strix]
WFEYIKANGSSLQIVEGIKQQQRTQYLYLRENLLETIPQRISMKYVKIVDVSFNHLHSINFIGYIPLLMVFCEETQEEQEEREAGIPGYYIGIEENPISGLTSHIPIQSTSSSSEAQLQALQSSASSSSSLPLSTSPLLNQQLRFNLNLTRSHEPQATFPIMLSPETVPKSNTPTVPRQEELHLHIQLQMRTYQVREINYSEEISPNNLQILLQGPRLWFALPLMAYEQASAVQMCVGRRMRYVATPVRSDHVRGEPVELILEDKEIYTSSPYAYKMKIIIGDSEKEEKRKEDEKRKEFDLEKKKRNEREKAR